MNLRHCPMCDKLFDPDESTALPFCSSRCRMADLNRWLTQGYGMPGEPPEEGEEAPRPPRDEDDS